jgi:hypothetical protein
MQEQNVSLQAKTGKRKKNHMLPICISYANQKKNMGFLTRLKAGSMLPERTTTTGDSLPVKHIKAFHIIKAIDTIIPAKQKKIKKSIKRKEKYQ